MLSLISSNYIAAITRLDANFIVNYFFITSKFFIVNCTIMLNLDFTTLNFFISKHPNFI